MVFKIAFSYFGSKADAEDVMQDVFLKVLRGSSLPEREDDLKAWLIRITVNRCHSIFRSPFRRRAEWMTDYEWGNLPEPGSMEDKVATKQTVYQAVMRLPAKYRLVVHLYYYEDMQVKDIAKTLGIKETTAQTRLARARKMLKRDLKDLSE